MDIDALPPSAVVAFGRSEWLYGAVALLLVVEAAWPHRHNADDSLRRWALHVALFGVAATLAWGVAGALAWAGVLIRGTASGSWAGWWHLAAMLLALDLAHYAMHRLNHRVALLWRWHSLHHADTMLDIGTTWRHHPLEAVTTGLALGVVALAIGARPAELAVYAVLSLTIQIAAHANLRFPAGWGWLSAVLVTPSIHHLHHAPDVRDTDSNYGQVLSLWDRIFGTYNPPRGAVERFGLSPARDRS